MAAMLICVSLGLEPLAGENPLFLGTQDHYSIQVTTVYLSRVSSGTHYDQSEREASQLGWLCTNSLSQ